MNPKTLLLRNSALTSGLRRFWTARCYSTEKASQVETVDITSVDEKPLYAEILTKEEQAEIRRKRQKSRLNPEHLNHLKGVKPYRQDMAWFHNTIRYKRRILGRYGMNALDVPAGALWPTKEEIDDKILYEKTAYPRSIQEEWKIIEDRNREKEEAIRLREEQIEKNLAMVGKWEKELKAKLAKKEADLTAAKERRARMIEEVRRQFGFAIDPRDERFKQLLEQKEKEDKKRLKEVKKKEKAAKFIAHMMEKTKTDTAPTSGETAPIAETKQNKTNAEKKKVET